MTSYLAGILNLRVFYEWDSVQMLPTTAARPRDPFWKATLNTLIVSNCCCSLLYTNICVMLCVAEYELLCGNPAPGFIIDIHTGKPIGKTCSKDQ